MSRILVSDPLPADIIETLRREAEVEVVNGLNPAQLAEKVVGFDALVVRSQSKVTREVIAAGTSLKIIGRAGVGVDNIDVEAATARGVVVVNSPEGNTISAAEHTMAILLAAARHVPQAHASMRRGEWDRKSFTGSELYNKTIGVVGFGRIGREVASRAASFRMRVLAYDPFVSPEFIAEKGGEPFALDELLQRSDFVTLHMPKTAETHNLINAERLAMMKPTAFLVNCARGGIIDEEALYQALSQKKLAGAALDVYVNEPIGDSPLLTLNNLVTTPHLAASTHEAQERVAIDVAEQVLEVLRGGAPRAAVNIPYLPPEVMGVIKPYLGLAEKMGRFIQSLSDGAVQSVAVTYRGELAEHNTSFLTKSILKGLLSPGSPDTVNYVNAVLKAKERGISISEAKSQSCSTYSSLIELELQAGGTTHRIAGTLFNDNQPRVVDLDGYKLAVVLEGVKLITWQTDCPGVVGRVGSLLGTHDINIAEMQLGRRQAREKAVMVLGIDDEPKPDVLEAVRQLGGIERVRLVHI